MKTITKSRAYADLKYIKENCDVDTSEHLRAIAISETIPSDTIIFINKYKPLEQFYTYNKIYENRRKNPLYRNLVNENLSDYEKAIALSSFVTQSFIHNKELLKENKDSDSQEFLDMMNLDNVFEALSEYSKGDSIKLNECFNMIRDVFKKLY